MTIRRSLLVISVATVTAAIAAQITIASTRGSVYSWLDPLIDVQSLVMRDFVDEPDRDALRDGAIQGMLDALGDPYTEFIPAQDIAEFDKQTRGRFVGIGAEVRMQDGWLLIVSPLEDSPAYRAGVMAGDRVTAINGETTFNKTVYDCIELLTGEPGTPVTITVERAGQEFQFVIQRAEINTPTVKGVHRINDQWDYWIDPESKIAYIRLTQFTDRATRDFEEALLPLVNQGLRGLVLDLRFNPGGLLTSAIDLSDLFLKEGLIVSTKGRSRPEQRSYARPEDTLPDFPMVVLINRQSASAAEILSGALADNKRAITLGERTFGKGSVQAVVALPSGAGQLKMTEAHYFLASGRMIHRTDDAVEWGVDPTQGFYVPMSDDEYREMLRIRREEEIIRPRSADETKNAQWSDPAWILDHMKDKQLAAAVEAITHRLAEGEWKPTGESLPENGLALAELERAGRIRDSLERELMRLDRQIEALASGADEDALLPAPLLPEADLTGGTVKIYDAEGKEIGELRITGPNLGAWLRGGPVEKAEETEPE